MNVMNYWICEISLLGTGLIYIYTIESRVEEKKRYIADIFLMLLFFSKFFVDLQDFLVFPCCEAVLFEQFFFELMQIVFLAQLLIFYYLQNCLIFQRKLLRHLLLLQAMFLMS